MKQPKKPTLTQKKIIASHGLTPSEWMVHHENGSHLHLVRSGTKEIKILAK